MKIFKGTVAQCLKHFARTNFEGGNKREALMAFTRVRGETTMRRWLNQGILPTGEPLIRLEYYLDFIGYDVRELAQLLPPVREMGRIIAFGIVELDEAVREIGLPNNKKSGSQLLAILRGAQGVSAERKGRISAFNAEFRNLLKETEQSTPRLTFKNSAENSTPQLVPRPDVVRKITVGDKEHLMKGFAHMVQGMLHQVDFLLSDDFSPEDRERVRQLAGGDGVFRLSNRLNRLCGERARREISSD